MSRVNFQIPPANEMIGLEVYRQYKFDPVIARIFSSTKDFFHQFYQTTMQEGLSQQQWDYDGNNEYISYYYQALYGFLRPYGKGIVQNQYDTGKTYDTGNRWDDIQTSGYMPITLYKILVKHLFSYTSNSFTLVWLWNLVREFCNTTDFTFTTSSSGIVINIAESVESSLLESVFVNELYNQNLPLTPITFNLTQP